MDYKFPPVPLQPLRTSVTIVQDASDTHVGGFLESNGQKRCFSEKLPSILINSSSTLRETYAVKRVLQHWLHLLQNTHLLIKTDSSGCYNILGGRFFKSGGSNNEALNDEAIAIYLMMINNAIYINIVWHRRTSASAVIADKLSKPDTTGEYGLRKKFFAKVNAWYKKQTGSSLQIDTFASLERHQVPKFFSRYECQASLGNALHSGWIDHHYTHPPLKMVPEAFQIASKRCGIFIIPDYKYAWWRSTIVANAVLEIGPMKDVLENASGVHPEANFSNTKMLALLLGSYKGQVKGVGSPTI